MNMILQVYGKGTSASRPALFVEILGFGERFAVRDQGIWKLTGSDKFTDNELEGITSELNKIWEGYEGA